jgi:hypothetical protein
MDSSPAPSGRFSFTRPWSTGLTGPEAIRGPHFHVRGGPSNAAVLPARQEFASGRAILFRPVASTLRTSNQRHSRNVAKMTWRARWPTAALCPLARSLTTFPAGRALSFHSSAVRRGEIACVLNTRAIASSGTAIVSKGIALPPARLGFVPAERVFCFSHRVILPATHTIHWHGGHSCSVAVLARPGLLATRFQSGGRFSFALRSSCPPRLEFIGTAVGGPVAALTRSAAVRSLRRAGAFLSAALCRGALRQSNLPWPNQPRNIHWHGGRFPAAPCPLARSGMPPAAERARFNFTSAPAPYERVTRLRGHNVDNTRAVAASLTTALQAPVPAREALATERVFSFSR